MRAALGQRGTAVAILLASAAVLATALAFQYLGGLAPCPLCLYQRYPYTLAIALCLGVALWRGSAGDQLMMYVMYVVAAGFVVGAGVGIYHVGVEQGWWVSAACGGAAGADTATALRQQLESTPLVRCDEIAWSLLGVSLAGYNVLASAALAAASLAAAHHSGRAGQPGRTP